MPAYHSRIILKIIRWRRVRYFQLTDWPNFYRFLSLSAKAPGDARAAVQLALGVHLRARRSIDRSSNSASDSVAPVEATLRA